MQAKRSAKWCILATLDSQAARHILDKGGVIKHTSVCTHWAQADFTFLERKKAQQGGTSRTFNDNVWPLTTKCHHWHKQVLAVGALNHSRINLDNESYRFGDKNMQRVDYFENLLFFWMPHCCQKTVCGALELFTTDANIAVCKDWLLFEEFWVGHDGVGASTCWLGVTRWRRLDDDAMLTCHVDAKGWRLSTMFMKQSFSIVFQARFFVWRTSHRKSVLHKRLWEMQAFFARSSFWISGNCWKGCHFVP